MTAPRLLDLFSGIGGFSLGLERAGFRTVAFCEIEPFCRRVLAKHWPEVPCYDDVRTLTAERLAADGIAVDAICGGFPCQDISMAGKGAGLAGERSGLWREYARLIGEIRPRYVIVENVAALLGRGLADVLGDLAALGFDAEWHCIPASALGAPHQRDRVWIVACPAGERREEGFGLRSAERAQRFAVRGEASRHLADTDRAGFPNRLTGRLQSEVAVSAGNGWWRAEPDVGRVAARLSTELDGGLIAEACDSPQAGTEGDPSRGVRGLRREQPAPAAPRGHTETAGSQGPLPSLPHSRGHELGQVGRAGAEGSPLLRHLQGALHAVALHEAHEGLWPRVSLGDRQAECDEAVEAWERGVPRVARGVPDRVARLRGLGNAVVPQIPELIGRAILQAEAA